MKVLGVCGTLSYRMCHVYEILDEAHHVLGIPWLCVSPE